MKNERIYFMDPLRGILMALGVVLHAGQVFNPDSTWLIHSADTTPIAAFLISVVHVFRMPAFYIVSGFFALLTLRKYGSSNFLKLRAEKILIPFAVTALTLNSLERWMLQTQAITNTRYSGEAFHISEYLLEGQWVSHLWFLGYLFAYVLLVYIAARFLVKPSVPPHPSVQNSASFSEQDKAGLEVKRFKNSKVLLKLQSIPFELFLLLFPCYYLALVILGKLVPAIYEFRFGFSVYDFLFYLQFFAFGLILCWQPGLFQRFTRVSFWKVSFLFGVWLLVQFAADRVARAGANEVLQKILEAYSLLLIVWISCHVIFSIFKKWLDRPSKFASFMSSVSYTVYLFHHSLVVLFGLLFLHYGLGGLPGFILLTILVAFLGASIHVVFISKNDWASYLFNGVRLRRNETAP